MLPETFVKCCIQYNVRLVLKILHTQLKNIL